MSLHQKHSSHVPWLHSIAARVTIDPDISSEMLNFPVCAKTVSGAHSSGRVCGTVTSSPPPLLAVPFPSLPHHLTPVPDYSAVDRSFFLLALTLPHLRVCPRNTKRGDNILAHFTEAMTKAISICHSR